MHHVRGYIEATLGCDPEIFLRKKVRGRMAIVPSSMLIPDKPILAPKVELMTNFVPSIVRDGVQVELHPEPYACRANLSNSLQRLFGVLKKAATDAGLEVDFSSNIKLTPGEMARLGPADLQLGCLPSLNAYGRPFVQKDGTKYRWRSGGGHIHIDLAPNSTNVWTKYRNSLIDKVDMVKLLDLLVGLPLVLVDRDPLNKQRRKLYGRAGEYRTPPHGLEYRTLSNFWLKSYPLMSMVFGMVHNALNVYPSNWPFNPAEADTLAKKAGYLSGDSEYWMQNYVMPGQDDPIRQYMADLRKCPKDLVERAINENDFDLANDLYQQFVRPFFLNISSSRGVDKDRVRIFDAIVAKGIDNIWVDSPLDHWVNKLEGHRGGFEDFCARPTAALFTKKEPLNGTNQHPTATA